MCFVITDEIFPVKYLKSQSITKLDVLVLPNSMSFVVSYGYAPVIRLKMAISGRHAHIHADKMDISR